MKVIHIITLLELGGAQQNTLFTVEHLNREKFEVGLIAGQGAFLDEEAKRIPNLSLYFLPNLVRSLHPIKDLISLFQLVQILKTEKPYIVHTHSSKAGILGRLAARIAKVPILIHSIHGFGFNPYQNYFIRKLYIFLERWVAAWTHQFIAVTTENIEEGIELGIGRKEQYRLIRSGVDIKEIQQEANPVDITKLKNKLKIPSGSKVVLTVGPFKEQKNPLAFVKTAKIILERCPETYFLMVGDGELRKKIEKSIQDSRLGEQIILLGWKRNIPELLAACDLFMLTSLWEGLPRAAVEALIVGKPVVAFAVNGLQEIVENGKNGYLVPPKDTKALAQKAVEILSNDRLEKQLSENALKSIDTSFDIHTMVHQQENLYETLQSKPKLGTDPNSYP